MNCSSFSRRRQLSGRLHTWDHRHPLTSVAEAGPNPLPANGSRLMTSIDPLESAHPWLYHGCLSRLALEVHVRQMRGDVPKSPLKRFKSALFSPSRPAVRSLFVAYAGWSIFRRPPRPSPSPNEKGMSLIFPV